MFLHVNIILKSLIGLQNICEAQNEIRNTYKHM